MKNIPLNTLDELRPPNSNFIHFENWQSNPFKHDAVGFELVNAWWLAEAALLAYGDGAFVRQRFEITGLNAAGFSVQCFDHEGTQCFVAHNDSFVIVSFRGTDIFEFREAVMDLITDAKLFPLPDWAGGLVHHGFNEALSGVWEDIRAFVNKLRSDIPTRTLWFTGHSLGAALATLAADRFIRDENSAVAGLYTFGSPRVGDSSFKRRLAEEGIEQRTFLFVNNNDAVTRVPLRPLYVHVGSLMYIDEAGHIKSMDEDSLIKSDLGVSHLSKSLMEGFHTAAHLGNITNDVPDSLADHAPIYYAVHIWNNYERQLG